MRRSGLLACALVAVIALVVTHAFAASGTIILTRGQKVSIVANFCTLRTTFANAKRRTVRCEGSTDKAAPGFGTVTLQRSDVLTLRASGCSLVTTLARPKRVNVRCSKSALTPTPTPTATASPTPTASAIATP